VTIEFCFEGRYIDTMDRIVVPSLIYILHVAVKDAELVQKFGFIKVLLHLVLLTKACLYPGFGIKARISIELSFI
jgi:hypothetical protein